MRRKYLDYLVSRRAAWIVITLLAAAMFALFSRGAHRQESSTERQARDPGAHGLAELAATSPKYRLFVELSETPWGEDGTPPFEVTGAEKRAIFEFLMNSHKTNYDPGKLSIGRMLIRTSEGAEYNIVLFAAGKSPLVFSVNGERHIRNAPPDLPEETTFFQTLKETYKRHYRSK